MKKILIVEDEKVLADMYREKFVQAEFEVVVAYDAEGGLALAKKEKPDIILLDILLPKANGIFLLEKLKKIPSCSSIAVVAFSNYDDPDMKKKAYQLGAKAYLLKTSYTPEEIVNKVKEYLNEEDSE